MVDDKTNKNNSNEKIDEFNNFSRQNKGGCPNPYIDKLMGVSFSREVLETLGPIQLEVLYKYWVEDKTIKMIANERKTSLSAVKNIFNKLKSKHVIDKLRRPINNLKLYENNGGGSPTLSPQNSKGLYRVHGQNHSIKILSTSSNYLRLNFPKKLEIDSNTILLYRRKIVIYSNTSFFDDIPDNCFEKSNVYWNNLLVGLESDLKIKLIDGIKTQIHIFRQHIAKTNDALAKKVTSNKLNYEFRDDLGRLRLIIDNSKGLWEFEAVDAELCQDDINIIKNVDGDYITKSHYLPSETKEKLDVTQEQLNELLLGVTGLLKINEKHESRIYELESFIKR